MDADEDDVAVVNEDSKPSDEGKSWADIIPETERRKLEEEEQQKKQLEMYLPPRNRKTVKKVLFVSLYKQIKLVSFLVLFKTAFYQSQLLCLLLFSEIK